MNLFLVLAFLICVLGCGYQVFDISRRYFAFKTRRYVNVHIIDSVTPPGVSTCWSLSEMLKIEHNGTRSSIEYWDEVYSFMKTATVKELLMLTPSNETVLSTEPACLLRFPDQMAWRIPWYNRTECHEFFKVEKYLYRSNVCYKFMIRDQNFGQLNPKHASLSPFLYLLFLNTDIFLSSRMVTMDMQ